MKGGTVVVATAPFSASLTQQSLMAAPRTSGLEAWLEHMGVTLEPKLVMDAQNAAFPAPVTRQVGGFSFQELVMLDYPYFVDVRGDGMNDESPIVSGLPQVTLTWASPIEIDAERQEGRTVTELLRSSPRSWLSADTNVMPRIDEQGLSGFVPAGEQAPRLLGAVIEGRFESFFAGQTSPLLEPSDADEGSDPESDGDDETGPAATLGVVSSVIDRSADSARLFVFSSDGFLADQNLRMLGSAEGTIYNNTVQMMVNVVDWSLEDQSLLSIRSRGHFNRTLPPLLDEEQLVWEYLNYGLALLGIGVVFLVHRGRKRRAERMYAGWLAGGAS
jgi:ABC-2 type transport system permease protein